MAFLRIKKIYFFQTVEAKDPKEKKRIKTAKKIRMMMMVKVRVSLQKKVDGVS
jgi:hypothetical protein